MRNRLFICFFDFMITSIEEKLVSNAAEEGLDLLERADRKNILEGILAILYRTGFRCLLLEYHVCDQTKKLYGSNVKEKLSFYQNKYLSDMEYRNSIFRTYPELDQMCRDQAEKQVAFVLEMFYRLQKDKEKIETKILGGQTFYTVKEVRTGKGDLHCGGRSVVELRLDIGIVVYYKPHPVVSDIIFYKFMDEIEDGEAGYGNLYRCLDCIDYGWIRGIEHQECSLEEQIHNFYKRIGRMAGVCDLLGSHDLHYQNLIACGEYPVLVDLENIFRTDEEKFRIGEDTELKYSILDSNLFPISMRERRFCAVTGGNGGKGCYQVPGLHVDEEGISVTYGRPYMERGMNYPKRGISAAEYLPDIREGYDHAWRCILHMTDVELKKILPGNIFSRYLVHSTQLYHSILEASLHPSLMMEPEEREAFIRKVCPDGNLLNYEVKDLLMGDIPYFYRKADSKSLFVSSGYEIKDYFKETMPEAVMRRKHAMNEKRRKLQCELLQMSLNLTRLDERALENGIYAESQEEGREKEWLELAVEMADKIVKSAIWSDDETMVTWFTLQCTAEEEIDAGIKAIDYYLYNGLAGIAVFLRAMELVCGGYDKVCAAAETALFAYTDYVLEGKRKAISGFTGAYCGEASVMYAYQILYGITGKKKYLRYAGRHAEIVMGFVEQDTRYDLLYGNAGAVCVFCNMYELTREEKYLAYAQRTEQLLRHHLCIYKKEAHDSSQDEKSLCVGMAHGCSGFIMSYGRLSRHVKDGWIYDEILESLLDDENAAYMRRAEKKNNTAETSELPSWCRGNLGIALAYLDLRRNTGTKFDSKISAILKETNRMIGRIPLRRSMSMCHGNMGNLMMATKCIAEMGDMEQEQKGEFKEKVRKLLSHEGIVMETEKMNCGMMVGCAGIGWVCLTMSRDVMCGTDILAVRVPVWGGDSKLQSI